jgi:hypothetical protein
VPVVGYPQADTDTVLGIIVERICWHKARWNCSLF